LPSFEVRKLSCKIKLFWLHSSLNDPTPFLNFCDYLPFEEDLALYLNKLEFLHFTRMICSIFDSFWLAGSGEDFKIFQCISTLLLLPSLGEGQSPSFVQT
jgi:hypothetical protein